ncbi:MAG: hypothetical protein ABIE92_00105 [bacterium]
MKRIVNEASDGKERQKVDFAQEKLENAVADIDVLIEHFSQGYPNQTQTQVLRRIRQQVLAAGEQLKKSGVGA